MKAVGWAECVGGPKCGERYGVFGTELMVPLPAPPATPAEEIEPRVPPHRVGVYRLVGNLWRYQGEEER